MKYNDTLATMLEYGNSASRMIELALNDFAIISRSSSSEDISSNADVAMAFAMMHLAETNLQDTFDLLKPYLERLKELNSEMDEFTPRAFKFDDEGNCIELQPGSDEAMAVLAADGKSAVQDTFTEVDG